MRRGSLQSPTSSCCAEVGSVGSCHCLESELGFILRLFHDCSLVFNRCEMMKSRSFLLSLILLGAFLSFTRGWMDLDGSRRPHSDLGRLHQEVRWICCCCSSCLCLCCSEAFCPVKTEQVGAYIPVCLYRAPDEVSGEMAIV